MSADDGIYILETGISKKEYRVAHLQAIENIAYDKDAPDFEWCNQSGSINKNHDFRTCPSCRARQKKFHSDDPNVHIRNARDMWGNCQVFTTEADAMHKAMELYRECCICEYGIQTIAIERDF